MRFASLGSGSRGNATVVEVGTTRVLVDCGFSVAETERRLARLGLAPSDLQAILVTHEHNDHVSGVGPLARRHRIPVWMTAGTGKAWRGGEVPSLHLFTGHEPFAIGDLRVSPYPVPHDAREPSQFLFDDGNRRLGVLTDTGCSTAHIEASLTGADALLLECNHDAAMLAAGPYPPSLKQRVGGRLGHLSNDQSAGLLARLDVSRLQHLAVAHLSEQNNSPDLARAALAGVLGCAEHWIAVAEQGAGLSWRDLS